MSEVPLYSGDTVPCRKATVILHGISPQIPFILHGTVPPNTGHPTRGCALKRRSFYTGWCPQMPVILHGLVSSNGGHPTQNCASKRWSSYTGWCPQMPVILHGTVPPNLPEEEEERWPPAPAG